MRYLPHTDSEIREMLATAGAKSIGDLFRSIPKSCRFEGSLNLPKALSEQELLDHLKNLSSKNKTGSISFLGAGAYRHFVPSAVANLVARSEFITPYTPYQPEISQGTLQTVFEYQTMICALFGMDIANASHYDGATATAEAALLAAKQTRRNKIAVSDAVHPEYRETIETILNPSGIKLAPVAHDADGCISKQSLKDICDSECAGLVAGYPNFFGVVDDLSYLADAIHKAGGLMITTTPEPLSLGLIEAPGAFGADIACAEGQSFGCGLNFGGPYLGIFTVKEKYLRMMPGRVVGETTDADGKRGYVLTFATREQHIRREKATSNICSNEALCAASAAIYLALLGKAGLTKLAELNYAKAEYLKNKIKGSSLKIKFSGPTFNEFIIDAGKPADDVLTGLQKQNIYGGVALGRWYPQYKNCILACVTELNSREEIDKFANALCL